ncbi:hypothetical protein [Streptomyces albireticuli]|nr:hypothetical protein [Streptomyces albireticuli]
MSNTPAEPPQRPAITTGIAATIRELAALEDRPPETSPSGTPRAR